MDRPKTEEQLKIFQVALPGWMYQRLAASMISVGLDLENSIAAHVYVSPMERLAMRQAIDELNVIAREMRQQIGRQSTDLLHKN